MDDNIGNNTPNVSQPQPQAGAAQPQANTPNQSAPYTAGAGANGQQQFNGQQFNRAQGQQQAFNGAYPQYNYAAAQRPSLFTRLYGKNETPLDSLLMFVSIIMFILAPLAILFSLFSFITMLIDGGYGATFTTFITYMRSGIFNAAIYLVFACMLRVGKKRVDKK